MVVCVCVVKVTSKAYLNRQKDGLTHTHTQRVVSVKKINLPCLVCASLAYPSAIHMCVCVCVSVCVVPAVSDRHQAHYESYGTTTTTSSATHTHTPTLPMSHTHRLGMTGKQANVSESSWAATKHNGSTSGCNA